MRWNQKKMFSMHNFLSKTYPPLNFWNKLCGYQQGILRNISHEWRLSPDSLDKFPEPGEVAGCGWYWPLHPTQTTSVRYTCSPLSPISDFRVNTSGFWPNQGVSDQAIWTFLNAMVCARAKGARTKVNGNLVGKMMPLGSRSMNQNRADNRGNKGKHCQWTHSVHSLEGQRWWQGLGQPCASLWRRKLH